MGGQGHRAFSDDVKAAKEWRLGAALEAGIQHTFIGAIDELRVYGVALTADQVKNLFDHDDVNAPNACPRAISASER